MNLMANNPADHPSFTTDQLPPLSLFHRPMYRGTDRVWRNDLRDSALHEHRLTWNLGALLSTMSLGYALGDRTLFRELNRRPWLAEKTTDEDFHELPIPPHGRRWLTSEQVAERLYELLELEIQQACLGYRKLVLLLSGGLDSRVVAGVVRRLLDQGRIKAEVLALTWGIPNSRDVVLGREVAESLSFDWQHVEFEARHLEENIELCRQQLCGSVSPMNLHRMKFVMDRFSFDTLVLAGSYGDSIGRGEYSKRWLLELRPLQPFNYLGLIRPELAHQAQAECDRELEYLRTRAGRQPDYVHFEHQQQGHYTRGLLGQAMSVIHHRVPVYQVFTHPAVYSYMWSVHPAARTDDVYLCLLKILGRTMASIPWARTNAAIDTSRKDRNATLPNFHNYLDWTRCLVDHRMQSQGRQKFLDEFKILGFLDQNRFAGFVDRLVNPDMNMKYQGSFSAGVFLWLECLRRVANDLGPILQGAEPISGVRNKSSKLDVQLGQSRIRSFLSSFVIIRDTVRNLHRYWLRIVSLWQYPVEKSEKPDR